MAVTLTYDDTLSRVSITANGLAAADSATVERSLDQLSWTTVRGGEDLAVSAGSLVLPVYDYEFSPNVVNYYRVRGASSAAITFVNTTATVSDANATGSVTLAPTLPAALVVGDVVFIEASIRNSGTGTVNTPAGWTLVASSGNLALLGRVYFAGMTMPTVTFAGGVANATIIAKAYAFRNVALAPSVSPAALLNASAQNIAYPASTVPDAGSLVIVHGWKQAVLTSVATLAGMTELLDISVSAGDDASSVIDYQIQTTATAVAASSFVVTGGVSAISRGLVTVFPHAPFLDEQTSSLTPTLTAVWLKSISRPFLNQTVQVIYGASHAVTRPARVGVFDIVGRTLPVAVSDVRTSRRWTMLLRTDTETTADALDLILASGDVLYLQGPPACGLIVCYLAVQDVVRTNHPLRQWRITWDLPVIEVAAPGPDVVGSTVTWASVLAAYGTWAAVIAAHPTWADLLTLIGDPSEVIVP